MANEISAGINFSLNKPSVMNQAVGQVITGATFTMSGNFYIEGQVSLATSATVIPLGGVTQPHWCYIKNTDATNFVRIRNGSGGADVIKLKAGEFALFPWYDSATPYGIADTAACTVEYLITSL